MADNGDPGLEAAHVEDCSGTQCLGLKPDLYSEVSDICDNPTISFDFTLHSLTYGPCHQDSASTGMPTASMEDDETGS